MIFPANLNRVVEMLEKILDRRNVTTPAKVFVNSRRLIISPSLLQCARRRGEESWNHSTKMESGNHETKKFELGTQDVFLSCFPVFLFS